MFTGIVTDLGEVRSVEQRGDWRVSIGTAHDAGSIPLGASIACSGVCLTAVDMGPGWFAVDVSAETRACSTLGSWQAGSRVNLERPLRIGDELGGHLVLGHVDGVAAVCTREAVGDSVRFGFDAPAGLARFVAEKGSVALDGVSLTVNRVDGVRFEINLIPHTLACTTFGGLETGDQVNLEIDMLARYVARLNEGE